MDIYSNNSSNKKNQQLDNLRESKESIKSLLEILDNIQFKRKQSKVIKKVNYKMTFYKIPKI